MSKVSYTETPHIAHMEQSKKTFIFAPVNHKGGPGKTTTSVNLAAEFARFNLSVLLIDLDPQANASLHVGKEHPSEIAVTAAELLISEVEKLPLAIHEETNIEGVSLIYGSLLLGKIEDELKEHSPRPSEELKRKLEPLIGLYDIIIIDCPPSLKLLTSNALAAATHFIIPIESGSQYGLYGVTDLLKHVNKIKQINPSLECLGVLLTRHDERQNMCNVIEKAAKEQVGKIIPIKIPSSVNVNKAAAAQASIHSVDRTSKVARKYKELAEYIVDQCGIKIEKTEAGI